MARKDETAIYFGRSCDKQYYFLSNFWPCTLVLKTGRRIVVFQSSEQFYMYFKSKDTDYRESILNAKSPAEAKRLGRACTLREDWDTIKEQVMLKAIRLKFWQNLGLAYLLCETRKARLIEYTLHNDVYWGVNTKFEGKNRLGHLLMQVRTELDEQDYWRSQFDITHF